MAAGSKALLFSLKGKRCSSERPGAVQGALIGATQRTLDGEDRSGTMGEEKKEG